MSKEDEFDPGLTDEQLEPGEVESRSRRRSRADASELVDSVVANLQSLLSLQFSCIQ